MKRLSLSILLVIGCATLAAPHLKIQLIPAPLQDAITYTTPKQLPSSITVETFIGPVEITEPVLIELLNHPVMTRLKEIDQHGPQTYFGNQPTFNRYTHSVGVFALLRKHGCSLTEQIAGLLHDASHTVFSHVADHLFKSDHHTNYQDSIHEWYLHKMGIDKVLQRYNLTIEDINPDQPEFAALEQPRPRLCADRIQYIVYTGLIHGRITQKQLEAILNSLTFTNNQWVFNNQEHARTFADLAYYFTEHYWQTPENFAWSHWLCQALKQAIALELITSDDIHFGTDATILEILNTSQDAHIKSALAACNHADAHFKTTQNTQTYDAAYYPKIMIVDPLVQHNDDTKPIVLSQRDTEYQQNIVHIKQRMSSGIRLQFM